MLEYDSLIFCDLGIHRIELSKLLAVLLVLCLACQLFQSVIALIGEQPVACGAYEAHHFQQVGRSTHRCGKGYSAGRVECLVGNLIVVAPVHLTQIRESETECKQQSHVRQTKISYRQCSKA